MCDRKYNYYQQMMGDESEEKIADMCIFKNNTYMEHKRIIDDKIYKSIPEEKKQKFLDCIHECKTVGKSYEEAGLTQEEGFVMMDYSIGKTYYLRREPKKVAPNP